MKNHQNDLETLLGNSINGYFQQWKASLMEFPLSKVYPSSLESIQTTNIDDIMHNNVFRVHVIKTKVIINIMLNLTGLKNH